MLQRPAVVDRSRPADSRPPLPGCGRCGLVSSRPPARRCRQLPARGGDVPSPCEPHRGRHVRFLQLALERLDRLAGKPLQRIGLSATQKPIEAVACFLVGAARCDEDGNLWAAMGWVGDGYDGVHVFAPDGVRIGQIRMPEIIGNLCFGGTKRNRLFMAGSTSLYAVYVETRGGTLT